MEENLYNEKVDKILDEFDFYKVNKIMNCLNWTWRNEGVPTIAELRREARSLLKNACQNGSGILRTGGFSVEKTDDVLSLSFVVTEWTEDLKEGENDDA
jgi:hypothetical protein